MEAQEQKLPHLSHLTKICFKITGERDSSTGTSPWKNKSQFLSAQWMKLFLNVPCFGGFPVQFPESHLALISCAVVFRLHSVFLSWFPTFEVWRLPVPQRLFKTVVAVEASSRTLNPATTLTTLFESPVMPCRRTTTTLHSVIKKWKRLQRTKFADLIKVSAFHKFGNDHTTRDENWRSTVTESGLMGHGSWPAIP